MGALVFLYRLSFVTLYYCDCQTRQLKDRTRQTIFYLVREKTVYLHKILYINLTKHTTVEKPRLQLANFLVIYLRITYSLFSYFIVPKMPCKCTDSQNRHRLLHVRLIENSCKKSAFRTDTQKSPLCVLFIFCI